MAKPEVKEKSYLVDPQTGLPSKIDKEELVRLARLHVTLQEMAEWFKCTREYLSMEPFITLINDAKSETKQRLKQKALQRALVDNSDPMLKFCLKNYCKWSDADIVSDGDTPAAEQSSHGFYIKVIKTKGENDGSSNDSAE